jgi:hypothetical protein
MAMRRFQEENPDAGGVQPGPPVVTVDPKTERNQITQPRAQTLDDPEGSGEAGDQ